MGRVKVPRGFMDKDDLLAWYMRDFDPLADEPIDAEAVEETPTRSTYDCKVDGHVWLLGADRCHVCQQPRVDPGSSQ